MSCIKKISDSIMEGLETVFYRWGYNIASQPWNYIFGCLIAAAVCGLGFTKFREETSPEKLWIPQESEFVTTTAWLKENRITNMRFEYALVTADNILTPQVFQMLYKIHEEVQSITVYGKNYSSLCMRFPVLPTGDDVICYQKSLVEMFNYDKRKIENLSAQEIIDKINTIIYSPVYGTVANYSAELGGIERNETGSIVKATAAHLQWVVMLNYTSVEHDTLNTKTFGISKETDKYTFEWERAFIEKLLDLAKHSANISVIPKAVRSGSDVVADSIFTDILVIIVGMVLVTLFIVVMLGKCNRLEIRLLLPLAAVSAVGLSTLVSYGICSAFDVFYSPLHSFLPLMNLGIGIDDMFVIVQSYMNLSGKQLLSTLPERMGLALKHSGVSITITSVTDFAAFIIGATSALPALRSFCLYAAVGMLSLYILQPSFFVPAFTMDQKRIDQRKDGLKPWKALPPDWEPNECSTRDNGKIFVKKCYAKILLKKPVRICVLLLSLALLGFNVWGATNLKQEFNFEWMFPEDSYMHKYTIQFEQNYPSKGEYGMVFFGAVNYAEELPKIAELSKQMKSLDFLDSYVAWNEYFCNYTASYSKSCFQLTEPQFQQELSNFLFHPLGMSFRSVFWFDGNLTQSLPAPRLKASGIRIGFRKFTGPSEHIPAMDQIKDLVHSFQFTTGDRFIDVWAEAFEFWETDKVIGAELFRNVILALTFVFITTLLLIVNLRCVLMVLLCVIMTMTDVAGTMYFWDVTVGTVSYVWFILGIGLSVDYSAHIGYTWMTTPGSNDERLVTTLTNMAIPIFNGSFSTFLAVVVLAGADSYAFGTFFKVFILVIIYGVFHGLVFLPVILHICGPEPYSNVDSYEVKDTSSEITDISLESKASSSQPLKSFSYVAVHKGFV